VVSGSSLKVPLCTRLYRDEIYGTGEHIEIGTGRLDVLIVDELGKKNGSPSHCWWLSTPGLEKPVRLCCGEIDLFGQVAGCWKSLRIETFVKLCFCLNSSGWMVSVRTYLKVEAGYIYIYSRNCSGSEYCE
jgi:hypothetical protein